MNIFTKIPKAKLIWVAENGYAAYIHYPLNNLYDCIYTKQTKSDLYKFDGYHVFYSTTLFNRYCSIAKCPVLDKREAIEKDPSLIYSSPECSPDLKNEEYEIQKGRNKDVLTLMISDDELQSLNVFIEEADQADVVHGNINVLYLADHILNRQPVYLVSVHDYILWWLKHGARLGKFKNGIIKWFNNK